MNSYRPRCIDLFCGAGGMSLGFEEAGFDIVAGVELDPVHANVHQYNFPDCRVYRQDVTTLAGKQIIEDCGNIDVVIGGPPCQGFSLIGKRDASDSRNELVMEYMRLVSEIQPRYFVMENVKGLTVGYGKQYLEQAIEYIQNRGYEVVSPYKVLNAADYGVPQNRNRLFLLGYKKGEKTPSYPDKHKVKVTVEEAISDLPDIDSFEELINNDTVHYEDQPIMDYAIKMHDPSKDPTDFSVPRIWDPNKLTGSLRTNHTDVSKARFHATPFGETEKVSRFHKLDPKGQCNTLRAGTDKSRGAYTSPRPISPYFDRVISVREAERLHSFPDWFRMHKTKWHGFREVGNAVPPLLAKAVAQKIIEAMGILPEKPTRSMKLGDDRQLTLSVGQALTEEHDGRKEKT
ncbi:MAG: DNA cytosine methyltransferase [Lachnospiraceae bacterium]|nr:DNA cytosine methyltransferase [Lachnospiraceae bacterium]